MVKEPLSNYKTISVKNLQIKRTLEDDLSLYIGRWGRWQNRTLFNYAILGIICSWHMMCMNFFIPLADHWCKPPELFSNWTQTQWKTYSIPKTTSGWKECSMYDLDYTRLPDKNISNVGKDLPTVSCKYGWSYDTSRFQHSAENEWDLVCEREYLGKSATAAYNAGFLVGVLAFGQISDAIGRRKTILMCLGLAAFAGIILPLVPCLAFFSFLRFLVAMGLSGGGTAVHVILMEVAHTSNRAKIGSLCHFPWTIGFLLLPGISYILPNWRHLQLFISLPLIIFLPLFCLFPESIRWLVSQKREKEAFSILKKAAEMNKKEVPNYNPFHFLKEEDTNHEDKKVTLFDLFKYPNLRCRSLILYFNWFAVSFFYYGISLGTNSLGGDIYVNFLISGVAEIPTTFTTWWLMNKLGRRWPHFLLMGLGGLCCVATLFIEKGVYPHDWPIITLAMIGKFGASSGWIVIYLLSAEIYPTVARNAGLGSSSLCARIGSVIAPYVDLLRHYHGAAPLVLYGSVAVVAGILVLILPETHDRPIPESLEEAENMGHRQEDEEHLKNHYPQ